MALERRRNAESQQRQMQSQAQMLRRGLRRDEGTRTSLITSSSTAEFDLLGAFSYRTLFRERSRPLFTTAGALSVARSVTERSFESDLDRS